MLAIAGLNLSMVSLIGGFCKYYVDAKIGGLNSKIDEGVHGRDRIASGEARDRKPGYRRTVNGGSLRAGKLQAGASPYPDQPDICDFDYVAQWGGVQVDGRYHALADCLFGCPRDTVKRCFGFRAQFTDHLKPLGINHGARRCNFRLSSQNATNNFLDPVELPCNYLNNMHSPPRTSACNWRSRETTHPNGNDNEISLLRTTDWSLPQNAWRARC
jgi:hypothetical protein